MEQSIQILGMIRKEFQIFLRFHIFSISVSVFVFIAAVNHIIDMFGMHFCIACGITCQGKASMIFGYADIAKEQAA